MLRDRTSRDVAEAGHDVHDPFRNAGFKSEFAEPQRRHRRLFRRLENESAAARQDRTQLQDGGENRRIPGDDGPHHANRLAHRICRDIARERIRDGHARQIDRHGGIIVDHLLGKGDAGFGATDRRAHFDGIEKGELFAIFADQRGQFQENLLALVRRETAPRSLKRGPSCRNGDVDVPRLSSCQDGHHVPARRIERRESLTGLGVDPLAVYEQSIGFRLELGPGDRVCWGHGIPVGETMTEHRIGRQAQGLVRLLRLISEGIEELGVPSPLRSPATCRKRVPFGDPSVRSPSARRRHRRTTSGR